MIPTLDSCLICEAIRPELGGKLILLGYMGVCPNVDIGVPQLDQPLVLTFLFSGSAGDGTFMASFDVIDESSERLVAATGPLPCVAAPDTRTNLAPTLLLTFGQTGRFAVRCIVEGREVFKGPFTVSHRQFPPSV
jgi:hypothetical protein